MKTIFCDSRSQGEVHLYADDTTAFRIGNSTHGVVGKLNLPFEEIHTWSELKKTYPTYWKTEVMIIQKNRL